MAKRVFILPEIEILDFSEPNILLISTATDVGNEWDEFIDSGV